MASCPTPAPAEPPKKRRRRVPASGAQEDCGGCKKRGLQCDRRRPYCSQCLEHSSDCPGYPTTLTWGQGVASRGKFRGCSLPVQPSAISPPIARPQSSSQRPRANTISTTVSQHTSPIYDDDAQSPRKRMRMTVTPHPWHSSVPAVPFTNPFSSTPYSPGPQEWPASPPYGHALNAPGADMYRSPRDLFPLHTATGTTFHSMPWSISPHNHPESPATSEIAFPQTPSTSQSFNPYFPALTAASAASPSMPMRAPMAPPSSWSGSYTDSPPPENQHLPEHQNFHSQHGFVPRSTPSLPQVLDANSLRPSLNRAYSAPQTHNYANDNQQADEELPSDEQQPQPHDLIPTKYGPLHADDWSPVLAAPPSAYFQIHPRIQNLLHYYDQAICPVLVDADGPLNPYRYHILQLAMNSPGLQSAIGALVTNNLRMRRLKEIPRSGPKALVDKRLIETTVGPPEAEEQQFKASAIKHLNSKLSHPTQAKEDDVLATLMILSLTHVAASGFSRSKVQLAGVQKLLKMRGARQSEFLAWIESFFVWIDVMGSPINDRDTLLHGGLLDILDLSKSIRDVEHFCGCDGRLFKLIARLSRLNMLSQARPVKNLNDKDASKAPPPRDFYSLPPREEDKQYLIGGVDTRAPSPPLVETCPDMDAEARREFWSEWHNIHDRLRAWQCYPSPMPTDATEMEQTRLERAALDKVRLSEAFRSAALLYMERLANPSAPCDHPILQEHVEATLAQITAIGENSSMTKFLLWPLFVSGTEAVQPAHRDLIRGRCGEIFQESGFYNNVSGLQVLERIWSETRDPGHDGGQAFRWRKCMERVDGEYIVI